MTVIAVTAEQAAQITVGAPYYIAIKWAAVDRFGNHLPIVCLDRESAQSTASTLSSRAFPWRAQMVFVLTEVDS